MQAYEIRILTSDGSTAFVIAEMAPSDGLAKSSAARLAQDKPYEVWRDLERIVAVGHAAAKSV